MLPLVIVLDCHQRSQEGVLKSLSDNGLSVVGLSPEVKCPSFSSRYVHTKVLSPRLEDDPKLFVEFLISMPYRGVLLISNDLSALTIARHAGELEEAGFVFLLPNLLDLENAFDKWSCFNLAEEIGVKVPKSVLITSIEEGLQAWDSLRKPLIVKGTRLAGGNYVKISTTSELCDAWNKVDSYNQENKDHESHIILQEWLTYNITDIWSCEAVFDSEGLPIGFYSIQRIRSSLSRETGSFTSRLFAGQYVKNERLEKITEKLLKASNWKGLAHVEFMYVPDEDEYYLAEINPRLPGYSYFPSAAGFKMGYLYYQAARKERAVCSSVFKNAVYFESFRYPGDISESIYQIIKGNMSFKDFVLSYLVLLDFRIIKVVDPIRFSDIRFSLSSTLKGLLVFYRELHSWLKRKKL